MAKIHTFVETFDTLSPAAWTVVGDNPSIVENGRLKMLADGNFENVNSVGSWDFTASSVFWQVKPPTGASQVFFDFRPLATRDSVTNQFDLTIFQMGISIKTRNADVEVSEDVGTFDPALHGWFRVRHVSGTTIAFDRSPDGITWTQLGTNKTVNFDLTQITINMTAGGFSGQYAYVDNINTIPKARVENDSMTHFMIGSSPVSALYLGTEKMWP